MSTLNKTGLRLAAAGAAAALTLAAGAPAFAQETTAPAADDATTAPATDETTTPAAEETTPADENTETEGTEGGSEVEEEKDPAAEEEVPEEELPSTPAEDEEEWEEVYSYAYLDDVLEGANVGESVVAEPQFRIDGESLIEEPAATVLTFTDSTSLESIFSGDEWELTYHAYAYAPYDNCIVYEWGVNCVVPFDTEVGNTYTLSDPLYYDIVDEVDDDDAAAYYAWDIDAAELEEWVAEGYVLDGENTLSLVETAPVEESDYFSDFGLFYFQADLVLPELPSAEDPDEALPTTGNSSIILVSSAAAALLAGAVVFYMVRRRKTAANWE